MACQARCLGRKPATPLSMGGPPIPVRTDPIDVGGRIVRV